jgi:hypothetical protein
MTSSSSALRDKKIFVHFAQKDLATFKKKFIIALSI